MLDNEVTMFLLKYFLVSFCLVETIFMKIISFGVFFNNFSYLARINFSLLLSESSCHIPPALVFTVGKVTQGHNEDQNKILTL